MTDSSLLTRRQVVISGVASSAIAAMPGVAYAQTDSEIEWLKLLGTSEQGSRSAAPQIEGSLPKGLNGALYRNGPGLFERNGNRKQHLLDGDGLVQKLTFHDGRAHYMNRFVETPKFLEESAAGRFLHPTWKTLAPPEAPAEEGRKEIESQAGVTVYAVGDRIYALDETNPMFELTAETLEVKREIKVTAGDMPVAPKAHAKIDPETGDWYLVGQTYGRRFVDHVFVYDKDARQKHRVNFVSPRNVYYHDFLVTKKYVILLLHPAMFSAGAFLQGTETFVGSLNWRPDEGNVVAVIPKDGGDPKYFEAPASFMWHALNAFDVGSSIVADFISYDEPDMFIGQDALFSNIMRGRRGKASSIGKLRRYVIDMAMGKLHEEILDHDTHEFPMIDPRLAMQMHTVGYMTYGGSKTLLETGVKRIDVVTGRQQKFDFGERVYVGEPIFAAKEGGHHDEGWIICQCLDGDQNKTFFAVFAANDIEGGPLAKLWLDHHVPISFHGWWRGGGLF